MHEITEKQVDKNLLERIKIMADFQYSVYNEIGRSLDCMVKFDYTYDNGEKFEVVNPFLDDTGSFIVDPVEYYGEEFCKTIPQWEKIFKK